MKLRVVFFALGLTIAAPAIAQQAYLNLSVGSTGSSNATVTLTVSNDSGVRPDLVGFDIYRSAWGAVDPEGACVTGLGTRITPEPLPRNPGAYYAYSFHVTDSGLADNHLYFYKAYTVNAEREPILEPWEAFDVRLSYAPLQLGRPLLAVAKVYGAPWAAEFHTCERWCGPRLISDATAFGLDDVIGNGEYYELYGSVRLQSADLGYTFSVDEAVPTECVLAVASSTWGHVKSLFR